MEVRCQWVLSSERITADGLLRAGFSSLSIVQILPLTPCDPSPITVLPGGGDVTNRGRRDPLWGDGGRGADDD
jgi:hypothetical protein